MHVLVVFMCVVLGFALSTQVRSQDSDPLRRLSEEELVAILADLEEREQELIVAQTDLQGQLRELEGAANSAQAAREAAEKANLDALVIAGAIPVQGPGIVYRVTEGDTPIPPSVFVSAMAELRNGGAEAIELNGNRLSGRTWFGPAEEGVTVDGTVITSPYVWRAIGDSQTLVGAVSIRGGTTAQFRAYNADVNVQEADKIVIESVTDPISPNWAEVNSGS